MDKSWQKAVEVEGIQPPTPPPTPHSKKPSDRPVIPCTPKHIPPLGCGLAFCLSSSAHVPTVRDRARIAAESNKARAWGIQQSQGLCQVHNVEQVGLCVSPSDPSDTMRSDFGYEIVWGHSAEGEAAFGKRHLG